MRPDEDIIKDIRDVEAQLSPENLSWDGERPALEVRRARTALNKRRASLVKELGREPDYKEMYLRL